MFLPYNFRFDNVMIHSNSDWTFCGKEGGCPMSVIDSNSSGKGNGLIHKKLRLVRIHNLAMQMFLAEPAAVRTL